LSKTPYNFFQRGFHRLVLGNKYLAEFLLDLEFGLFKRYVQCAINQQHVFVSGLARSGTTHLLRTLYNSGEFVSLTYRSMPMVLAPNLWNRITALSNKRISQSVERAHGDGILVDYDSPEAFEEVFWKISDGYSYLKKDRLIPHVPSSEIIEKFQDYVALVLASNPNPSFRYLSKNNNNILRIRSIEKAFSRAIIIVPFRDPLQQAFSLLTQHRKFLSMHNKDKFISEYMSFIVHHEFGPAHRPFNFYARSTDHDTLSLDYWLSLWFEVYSWLMSEAPNRSLFLSYERYCRDHRNVIGQIVKISNINNFDNISRTLKERVHHIPELYSPDLYESCCTLYKKLIEKENMWTIPKPCDDHS